MLIHDDDIIINTNQVRQQVETWNLPPTSLSCSESLDLDIMEMTSLTVFPDHIVDTSRCQIPASDVSDRRQCDEVAVYSHHDVVCQRSDQDMDSDLDLGSDLDLDLDVLLESNQAFGFLDFGYYHHQDVTSHYHDNLIKDIAVVNPSQCHQNYRYNWETNYLFGSENVDIIREHFTNRWLSS